MEKQTETGRLIKSPVIYITPEAKQLLDMYIFLAEGEVSGLGEIETFGKRDFLIKNIFLLQQECTNYKTRLTKNGLRDFLIEMIRNGGDPAKLKLWWHSHADMEVFWSDMTDCQTIERFNNQWMVSVVGNRHGDFLGRADVYKPIRVTQDKLDVRVLLPADEELLAFAKSEMEEKVRYHNEKDEIAIRQKNFRVKKRGLNA